MAQHRVTDQALQQAALASQGIWVSLFRFQIFQRMAGGTGLQINTTERGRGTINSKI